MNAREVVDAAIEAPVVVPFGRRVWTRQLTTVEGEPTTSDCVLAALSDAGYLVVRVTPEVVEAATRALHSSAWGRLTRNEARECALGALAVLTAEGEA